MGMDLLYEKSDFREIFNKSVENKIAETEMPSNYVLKDADVKEETFIFHPIECNLYEQYNTQ